MDVELLVITIFTAQIFTLASLIYQVAMNSRRQEKNWPSELPKASTEVNQLENYIPRQAPNLPIVMSEDYLDTEELRVLSLVMDRNGEIYQAEIARELNVPKSTVSRIIRRLQDRGLITTRRIGRLSYIEITDTDYVADLLRKKRKHLN
jgi:uncharacterized membrane protein